METWKLVTIAIWVTSLKWIILILDGKNRQLEKELKRIKKGESK